MNEYVCTSCDFDKRVKMIQHNHLNHEILSFKPLKSVPFRPYLIWEQNEDLEFSFGVFFFSKFQYYRKASNRFWPGTLYMEWMCIIVSGSC